jgi:hypothetical protein
MRTFIIALTTLAIFAGCSNDGMQSQPTSSSAQAVHVASHPAASFAQFYKNLKVGGQSHFEGVAYCSKDYPTVVGGGYDAAGGTFYIDASFPNPVRGKVGWDVDGDNAATGAGSVGIYAICSSL